MREIEKRIVSGLRLSYGSELLDIVEGSPPSETKQETSKAQTSEKKAIRDEYTLAPAQTKLLASNEIVKFLLIMDV